MSEHDDDENGRLTLRIDGLGAAVERGVKSHLDARAEAASPPAVSAAAPAELSAEALKAIGRTVGREVRLAIAQGAAAQKRVGLLTLPEVEALMKLNRRSLRRLARKGLFPRPLRFDGAVRWRLSDIERCLDERAKRPAWEGKDG